MAQSWTGSDEDILKLFDDSLYIRNTLEADTEVTKSEEGALIELFKKQRPGEPPSVDAAKNLLNQLFFDPKRYDLTRVGRYKLNSRLHLDEPTRHAHAHPARHHRADQGAGLAAQGARHPRVGRVRGRADQGLRRSRRSRSRASRSRSASTSTSTSATAACARSAS